MVGPEGLEQLEYVSSLGERLDPEQVVVERTIKAEPGEPRRAYRVVIEGEPVLLKVQMYPTFKLRLRATLGRSYMDRELAATKAAKEAGLPVNHLFGRGERRSWGVVLKQAILWRWIEGSRTIDPVRDRSAVLELFARIRRAGFADKDFGVHNLLADGQNRLVWTDLERAYRAAVDDADATARSTGAALASWWLAIESNADGLLAFWRDIRIAAPVPAGGWNASIERINQAMMKKCDELIRRGRLDRQPPPVTPT